MSNWLNDAPMSNQWGAFKTELLENLQTLSQEVDSAKTQANIAVQDIYYPLTCLGRYNSDELVNSELKNYMQYPKTITEQGEIYIGIPDQALVVKINTPDGSVEKFSMLPQGATAEGMYSLYVGTYSDSNNVYSYFLGTTTVGRDNTLKAYKITHGTETTAAAIYESTLMSAYSYTYTYSFYALVDDIMLVFFRGSSGSNNSKQGWFIWDGATQYPTEILDVTSGFGTGSGDIGLTCIGKSYFCGSSIYISEDDNSNKTIVISSTPCKNFCGFYNDAIVCAEESKEEYTSFISSYVNALLLYFPSSNKRIRIPINRMYNGAPLFVRTGQINNVFVLSDESKYSYYYTLEDSVYLKKIPAQEVIANE